MSAPLVCFCHLGFSIIGRCERRFKGLLHCTAGSAFIDSSGRHGMQNLLLVSALRAVAPTTGSAQDIGDGGLKLSRDCVHIVRYCILGREAEE